MQSLDEPLLTDPKQAKKRLRKRARLQRAHKRKDTGIIRFFLLFLVLLSCYGMSFLNLMPGSGLIEKYYGWSVAVVQKKFNDISFSAGFQIQDISISGLKNLEEEEVLAVLGFGAGISSLNYDSRTAWKQLQQLKWVKKANVQLLLPGTLYIKIEEYAPYARIQEFGQHYLINEQGEILKYHDPGDYETLPLFVGFGSKGHAVTLDRILRLYPAIRGKVSAAIRVDDRRWDLLTKNGKRVMLPEKGVVEALKKMVGLEQKYKILGQDYALIDLRLADRLRLGKKLAKDTRRNKVSG